MLGGYAVLCPDTSELFEDADYDDGERRTRDLGEAKQVGKDELRKE